MAERKLIPNPPTTPGKRKQEAVVVERPKGGPPVCARCGNPMPGMRNVCTECGYATPWFKLRFWIGGFSVLLAAIGIGLMVLQATQWLVPPSLPPEDPPAVSQDEETVEEE